MGISDGLYKLFGNKLKTNEPLKNHCTIHTGGFCKYFLSANSIFEIYRAVDFCEEFNIKYKIIGNGSNLLFSDNDYNGLIISTEKMSQITVEENNIMVYAGTKLSRLIEFCEKNGYFGLESLYGIPATVGGAVFQNAGSFGKNISDYILEVETISNGRKIKRFKSDCAFSYRNSVFKNKEEIITLITFSSFEKIGKKKELYLNRRRLIQPLGFSCGSIFKNSSEYFAGEIIDRAGLKGLTVGGATVSDKHANFIINYKNATSNDVYALIKEIKERVFNEYGVKLKEEVEFVGEF